MGIRVQSIILMILGAGIFAVCLMADFISLGGNTTVIGWKQFAGAAVGLTIALMGAHLAFHHVIQK